MLNNTQPAVIFAIGNGVAGVPCTLGLTVTCHQAAFEKAKPDRGAVLVGYQDEWQAVANSTNSGGSGGLGPLTVVLTNNIPTY